MDPSLNMKEQKNKTNVQVISAQVLLSELHTVMCMTILQLTNKIEEKNFRDENTYIDHICIVSILHVV